ncbi:MAG: response regulator [Planctomycetota bacterium]
MKLEEIPAPTVRLAIEIYLRYAYPAASRWRAPVVDLADGKNARDLVARFEDESEEGEGRRIGRFVLRLGNSRYPHMKLVLEESILQHEYAFSVDTHDDLKVSPDAPDYERWNAVRDHNRRVAEEIEEAWRGEEIPTLRDIKDLLGAVEQLSENAQSVLVVDDDPAIRDALRALLERAGLRVRTAPNGRAALDQVADEQPNLILMDYQMPEMDGVAACEALKGDPETADIPVLLATRSQVNLAALTFADGFLVKPYRQDVLFSLVRKLLS